MNTLQRTPDHDLDQLLHAFYKAELPHPFPALKAPEPKPAPGFRWNVMRNRMALAASVCLLLVGGWLMAGRTSDFSPPTVTDNNGPVTAEHFVPFGSKGPAIDKNIKNESNKCPDCCCPK